MRPVRVWLLRILGLFRKTRGDREFAEELESHLQMHIDDGIRSGLTQEEARRAALMKLGGIEATKEIYRDRRGLPFLDTLARDLAYGLRMIRRSPGFSATVILTLALGIGATTSIFTVVNAVLLRPLPYPEPDRIVYISFRTAGERGMDNPFSYTGDYAAWRRHARTFSRIAGYMWFPANLTGGGEAERANCAVATESLFPLLGVQPALGRSFLPEEDRPGGPPVAILAHAFWKRRFGADPLVIGKTLTLDASPYTIVGVLPAAFRLPDRFGRDSEYDVWVPFAIGETGKARGGRILLQAIGRLKPGVTLDQARAELDSLMQVKLRNNLKKSAVVMQWQDQVAGGVKRSLVMFLFAVGFVLLIACVNVANLLLSRTAARHKEVAIRSALGAGRARILRQVLTESVLLALSGGALGLLLAFAGKDLLVAFLSPNLPALDPIHLDYRVLAFTFALALLTGIAFGLAPALQAAKARLNEVLKEAGRGVTESRSSGRVRAALVVFEVTLAVVLLSGAGLLLRSFLRLRGIDPGFRTDRVLTMGVSLTPSRYPAARQRSRFFQDVLERVRRLPGVESAAAGTGLRWDFATLSVHGVKLEGGREITADIKLAKVSSDYFRTMGIPVRRGRAFDDFDREGAPGVIVVNEAFARRFLPDGSPVGRRIENPDRENEWMTVVGVVGDVRDDPIEDPPPEIYVPYPQSGGSGRLPVTLVVRSAGDPVRLAAAVRSEIASVDKLEPPYNVRTLDAARAGWFASRRVNLVLVGVFAALALALGSIGIYGVLAYSVGRRTHEIGVRMALGAGRGQIVGMVLRRGLALIAAGAVAGIAASLGLTRLIASQLWGVSPGDPWTLVAVTAVLFAAGVAACSLPARRAVSVDPMRALRYE